MKKQRMFFSIVCLFSMQHALVHSMDGEDSYKRFQIAEAIDELTRRPVLSDYDRWLYARLRSDGGDAAYQLGSKAENGHGMIKNVAIAFRLYRYAESQGHVDASYALSRMYELGIGVEKDPFAASRFAAAAALGETVEPPFTELLVRSIARCKCVCL